MAVDIRPGNRRGARQPRPQRRPKGRRISAL